MSRKVLYIHDGPRWKDSKGNFHGTQDDVKLVSRYKYLGEKVDFMMRLFNLPAKYNGSTIHLNDYGIKIISIPPFNRPHLLLNYFKASRIIELELKNYDILVIRLPSAIGSLSLWIAKLINIPYLIEVVACPWDSLWNHSILGKLYAPIAYIKLKRQIKNAPYVIYVTKRFLQERYPNKGKNTNISNVMLEESTDKILEEKISKYKSFKKSKQIIIATIGAIDVPYKGHRFVLKAISILKKEGYIFKYLIIGGGESKVLRKKINYLNLKETVKILGLIEHNKIFSYLDKCDIYIQPSLTEGLPRALIEAMSRACACIGSSAGGIPELLESSVVFKKGNTEELVDRLRSVIDPKTLIKKAKLNYSRSKSFDRKYLEEKRHKFYDEFLKSI